MQRSWRILIAGISLAFVVLISFGAGVWAAPTVRRVAGVDTAPGVGTQTQVLWQVWNIVMQNYVDRTKLNPEQMMYGAIRGMLGTLDDPGHTRFLTRADYQDEEHQLQGTFTGVGVVLSMRDGQIVLQQVYPNSPASEAGLTLGDAIVSINGKPTAGMTSDAAAAAMRGPRGSAVDLVVRHAGASALTHVTLIRRDIHLTAVSWQMLPGTKIADIAIGEFNQGTTASVSAALKAAKTEGARSYLVDVRDDPGGLLDEAISVSSLFLPSGRVLIQRDAQGHEQPFNVTSGVIDATDPMVVLIDHGTASAAEIFAAAIRDNHRGTLIGSITDGTGTVLSTYRLLDGSALLLGTAEWLTPTGQSIWRHGITPDVSVALPPNVQATRPSTLNFPVTAAQVLANRDTVLDRGVTVLEAAGADRGP